MARNVPWRNKPTEMIKEMVQEAKELKLYLVSETGPTSFVFKDDHDNKFKVSIGAELNCSCGVVENDHCIHTLYVLLKKYKVAEHSPILWQASYLDNELDGLVQFKFSEKKKTPIIHRPLRRRTVQRNIQGDDGFPTISCDQSCPICYQQLNTQCYSQCQQCKNCLHSKCLKIWTKHKQQNSSAVTCPMCRAQFHNPIVTVLKDVERWATRYLVHRGAKCVGCGVKGVKGVLFHCVVCKMGEMCRLCYQAGQHGEHDRFLMKEKPEGEWVVAPPRNLVENRVPLLRTLAQQKASDELQKAITQKTTQDINTFLMNVYPTLKQTQNIQPKQSLGIIGNEIKQRFKQCCMKCGQPGSELMRKLDCGHPVHEQCLARIIRNHELECCIDGELFMQGYVSAFGINVRRRVEKSTGESTQKSVQEIKKQGRLPPRQQSAEHPKHKTYDMGLEINGGFPGMGRRQSSSSKPPKPGSKAFRIKKNTSQRRSEMPGFMPSLQPLILVTGMQQMQGPSRGIFRQGH